MQGETPCAPHVAVNRDPLSPALSPCYPSQHPEPNTGTLSPEQGRAAQRVQKETPGPLHKGGTTPPSTGEPRSKEGFIKPPPTSARRTQLQVKGAGRDLLSPHRGKNQTLTTVTGGEKPLGPGPAPSLSRKGAGGERAHQPLRLGTMAKPEACPRAAISSSPCAQGRGCSGEGMHPPQELPPRASRGASLVARSSMCPARSG